MSYSLKALRRLCASASMDRSLGWASDTSLLFVMYFRNGTLNPG